MLNLAVFGSVISFWKFAAAFIVATTAAKMVSVFPKPISSARMPPPVSGCLS